MASSLAVTSEAPLNRSVTSSGAEALEDEPEGIKRRFREIDDRRYREWNNFQIAQQAPDDGREPNMVFMDLSVGEAAPARLKIELFDETPETAANFRALLLGEKGFDAATGVKLDYVESQCTRIIPGVGCVLGELAPGINIAANGGTIRDENFANRHTARGTLSMYSRGPHTGGSVFMITFDKAPQLDFQQVAFGRIVDNLAALDGIEAVSTTRNGAPKTPIFISFCGALSGKAPQRSIPDGWGIESTLASPMMSTAKTSGISHNRSASRDDSNGLPPKPSSSRDDLSSVTPPQRHSPAPDAAGPGETGPVPGPNDEVDGITPKAAAASSTNATDGAGNAAEATGVTPEATTGAGGDTAPPGAGDSGAAKAEPAEA